MAEAWKRIEPTITHKVGYRHLVSKVFVQPNGKTYDYTTVNAELSRTVATIALTPDNEVVVARQYRPGPEMIMDDLPGGGVEHGEDLEVAARRELEEETGYTAATMQYLGVMHIDAYSNNASHYFLGTDCARNSTGQELDETEHISVEVISISQLMDNARNGRMTDVGAMFLAYEALKERML